ncbi:uncharacterized protein P884DRAFT_260139, partial [Thermothelomyces heterothallicus CBS 202.75]|uniref:uncharacterized protein n=1 Tax=Thermothelomyces heterothallicus CBS 202.75 TaxID=1149848 RepID=UPI003742E90D
MFCTSGKYVPTPLEWWVNRYYSKSPARLPAHRVPCRNRNRRGDPLGCREQPVAASRIKMRPQAMKRNRKPHRSVRPVMPSAA